jgi:hypothetical protein
MTGQIAERHDINRVFPWLKELSSDQLDEFYSDFFDALEQALQEKDWSILEECIESWQATAEVLADADLTTLLIGSSSKVAAAGYMSERLPKFWKLWKFFGLKFGTAPSSDDELEDWDDVEASLFDKTA